jgi:uncharacterized protein (DUF849 family)
MLLQAALNGPLTKDDHPAVPLSVEELAADAADCVAAGATSVHLHPREERAMRLCGGCARPAVSRSASPRALGSSPISIGGWT